jgi:hypothetical protein
LGAMARVPSFARPIEKGRLLLLYSHTACAHARQVRQLSAR